MGTIIVFLIFFLFCVFMAFYSFKNKKRNQKRLKDLGYNKKDLVVNLKYACGHPEFDKPGLYNLGIRQKNIYFLNFKCDELARIESDKIKNILVEDQTTFEKKVTLARMAMIGIFAFALKKHKKNELAYLTISWNDGRFDHDTVFEFQGVGSMVKANKIRNRIIKEIQ